MDMLHTTEVTAIFVRFFAYFGQNLVAMAMPLDPCNQKFLWIGQPQKPTFSLSVTEMYL